MMFILVLFSVLASTLSTTVIHVEPISAESHFFPAVADFSDYGGGFGDKSGAVLGGLAHSSAIQAKNAVQNQHTAGSQAEFGAKSNLASVATGAAKTAQAALVGKQAIASNLKHQLIEAQHQLQDEIQQYRQAQGATHAAEEAAHEAQDQLNTLNAALAKAQANAQHAGNAAVEATNTEAAQKAMVIEAKQKVGQLAVQLKHALGDLKDTEHSAQKAAKAAHIAQANAHVAQANVEAAANKNSHFEYAKYFF